MSLLDMQAVGVKLDNRAILHDIDLSINAGEIIDIIGPNGSGKTSLLRVMAGIIPISEGKLCLRSGLRIGYAPQSFVPDPSMPLTTERFLCLPERHEESRLAAILDQIGITHLRSRQMVELSGGQVQRVLLARALLGQSELILLDEPTRGLDQHGVAAFYRLIADLRRKTSSAIIITGHDLHVVMGQSDRVICLNGHICCEGSPEEISNSWFGDDMDDAMALYRHQHDHRHDDLSSGS